MPNTKIDFLAKVLVNNSSFIDVNGVPVIKDGIWQNELQAEIKNIKVTDIDNNLPLGSKFFVEPVDTSLKTISFETIDVDVDNLDVSYNLSITLIKTVDQNNDSGKNFWVLKAGEVVPVNIFIGVIDENNDVRVLSEILNVGVIVGETGDIVTFQNEELSFNINTSFNDSLNNLFNIELPGNHEGLLVRNIELLDGGNKYPELLNGNMEPLPITESSYNQLQFKNEWVNLVDTPALFNIKVFLADSTGVTRFIYQYSIRITQPFEDLEIELAFIYPNNKLFVAIYDNYLQSLKAKTKGLENLLNGAGQLVVDVSKNEVTLENDVSFNNNISNIIDVSFNSYGSTYEFFNLRPSVNSTSEELFSFVSNYSVPIVEIPSITIIGPKSSVVIDNQRQDVSGVNINVVDENGVPNNGLNDSNSVSWIIKFADDRNFAETNDAVFVESAVYLNYLGEFTQMTKDIDYSYEISNNLLIFRALKIGVRDIDIVLTLKDNQDYTYKHVILEGTVNNVIDSELLDASAVNVDIIKHEWTTTDGFEIVVSEFDGVSFERIQLLGDFNMPTVVELLKLESVKYIDNGELNREFSITDNSANLFLTMFVTKVVARDGPIPSTPMDMPPLTLTLFDNSLGVVPTDVSYNKEDYDDEFIINMSTKDSKGSMEITYYTVNSDSQKSPLYTLVFIEGTHFFEATKSPRYIVIVREDDQATPIVGADDISLNNVNVETVSDGKYIYTTLNQNDIITQIVSQLNQQGFRFRNDQNELEELTNDMFNLIGEVPYSPTVDINEYNNNTDKSRTYTLEAAGLSVGERFSVNAIVDINRVELLEISTSLTPEQPRNREFFETDISYAAIFNANNSVSGGFNPSINITGGTIVVSNNAGLNEENNVSVTFEVTDGVQSDSDTFSVVYTWDYYVSPKVDDFTISWNTEGDVNYNFWLREPTIEDAELGEATIIPDSFTDWNIEGPSYTVINRVINTNTTTFTQTANFTISYTGPEVLNGDSTQTFTVSEDTLRNYIRNAVESRLVLEEPSSNLLLAFYNNYDSNVMFNDGYLGDLKLEYWDGTRQEYNENPTDPSLNIGTVHNLFNKGDFTVKIVLNNGLGNGSTIYDISSTDISLSNIISSLEKRKELLGALFKLDLDLSVEDGSNLMDNSSVEMKFDYIFNKQEDSFINKYIDISVNEFNYIEDSNDIIDVSQLIILDNFTPTTPTISTFDTNSYIYANYPSDISKTTLDENVVVNNLELNRPAYYKLLISINEINDNTISIVSEFKIKDIELNNYTLPEGEFVFQVGQSIEEIVRVDTNGSLAKDNDVLRDLSNSFTLSDYYSLSDRLFKTLVTNFTDICLNTVVPAYYEITYSVDVPENEINELFLWEFNNGEGGNQSTLLKIKVVDTELPKLIIKDQNGTDITDPSDNNNITVVSSFMDLSFSVLDNGITINSYAVISHIQKLSKTTDNNKKLSTEYTIVDVLEFDNSSNNLGITLNKINLLNNNFSPDISNIVADNNTSYIVTVLPMNIEGKYLAIGKSEIILVINGGPSIELKEYKAIDKTTPGFNEFDKIEEAPQTIIRQPVRLVPSQRFSLKFN